MSRAVQLEGNWVSFPAKLLSTPNKAHLSLRFPSSPTHQNPYIPTIYLAEGEGFEPPVALTPLRFSRPLRSTAPASLRGTTSLRSAALPGLAVRAQALELVGVLLEVSHEVLLGDVRNRHQAARGVASDVEPLVGLQPAEERAE
jgi:hypothetical protein